jgi:hypothetical protein
MIVGFSKHGKGGGYAPVTYLTSDRNPDGTSRTPEPTVLRGNPRVVRELIDDLPYKFKYTSGVLSFEEKPWEVLPEVQESIMDSFETMAFAGLAEEQRPPVLWVRHEHAGRLELNFLIPRVEPLSGKSLNIAPPKSMTREMFDTFRSMINARHGFSDPDDPARTREVSLPNHIEKILAEARRKGEEPKLRGATALRKTVIEAITEHLSVEVGSGSIDSREGVVGYLEDAGYAIARSGKDYVTIIEPETGERIRLKGALYSKERFDPSVIVDQGIAYGEPDEARAEALGAKLERMTESRARYHQKRYGEPLQDITPAYEIDTTPDLPPHQGESLEAYLERTIGDDAILPGKGDDDDPPPSTQRRQRLQQMEKAEGMIERDGRDRDRTTATRRSRTLGIRVSTARDRTASELAELDRTTQRVKQGGYRLSAASRSLAGSASAVDEWLERWLQRFYGLDRGRDDYEQDWGMER